MQMANIFDDGRGRKKKTQKEKTNVSHTFLARMTILLARIIIGKNGYVLAKNLLARIYWQELAHYWQEFIGNNMALKKQTAP